MRSARVVLSGRRGIDVVQQQIQRLNEDIRRSFQAEVVMNSTQKTEMANERHIRSLKYFTS